jgi:hypothetical protein
MRNVEMTGVSMTKLLVLTVAFGLATPSAFARARADELALHGASRPAGVGRASAARLAKAKDKKRKKKADSGADSEAADSGNDAGAADDDRESSLLAPRKKASGDDDGGGIKLAASRKKASEDDDGGGSPPAASGDDDGDRAGKSTVAVKRHAPAPVHEETEEPSASPGPGTALELGLGGMALFRTLEWTSDARAAQLGPYSLKPGPEAGLWLEFYPAAFATAGFASNIGLFAHYAHGFGVTSGTSSGDVATSYQDFVAGLKLRVPLGTLTPYGTVAYGEQQFGLTPKGTPQDLPGMDYSFVRIGLGTRIQLSPLLGLDVGAAFLTVTNAGSGQNQLASQSFFPQTAAYAVEGGASLAIRVASRIGIRVGGDIRQYGISLNPSSSTTRQVTGAVDRYIVAWSGIEVLLDGQGASDDGATAAAPRAKHRSKRPDPSEDESSDDDSSTKDASTKDKDSSADE